MKRQVIPVLFALAVLPALSANAQSPQYCSSPYYVEHP